MKISKFFELLYSFSEKDLFSFQSLAKSKVFDLTNQNLNVLQFIIEYLTTTELEKDKNLETVIEEKIIQQFFEKIDLATAKKNWNHSKNQLINAIKKYIIIQQVQHHNILKDQFLLDYYQKKQLPKNYYAHLKKTQKQLDLEKKDFDLEYHRYKLHETVLAQQQGQQRQVEEFLKMKNALDAFYSENKLRLLVEQYNRHRIINTPQPEDILITNIKTNKTPLSNIGSQLLFKIYLMIESNTVEDYFEVKQLFLKHEKSFSKDYQKSFCEYLMNQCIFFCHHDQINFANDYIDFIKYLMKIKVLTPTFGFSTAKYINIIYMSLIANHLAPEKKYLPWVENFIAKYSPALKHKNIQSIQDLNQANILFHKNKNQEALALLSNYNYSEFYFKITFDKLCIKIYFEENMNSNLTAKLKAFKTYIKRNQNLKEDRKIKNLNFIKAVNSLGNSKQNKSTFNKKDFLILDYLWLINTSVQLFKEE